ncbi:hypothetical protein [Methylobacterium sp. J-076]|uniref:hypothetical protein n=1 Tax=Methylobacterium sp. J-076 TaxID=2836655 RepID=UPI001FBA94ED|nr:hypothetical protein [Methylobacterium sp. J-076]MCJ2014221.1 hypothetical protein [Methylobacterium sp. J-076]
MIIRAAVLRPQHIEGDPSLSEAIRGLASGAGLVQRLEGRPLRFRRAREAERPAGGLAPEPRDAAFWRALQTRRGATITAERDAPDPYLLSRTATPTAWNSPEDAEAHDGL